MTINSTSKTIPTVSDQQIAKYNTTYYSCDCQDRTIRGGSYIVDGQRVCKHMARQRSPQALVGPARRKAFAELAAKNAKLAELAKPSAEFVKLEAKNPALDPASCGAGLDWFGFIEFDELPANDTFAAFA